MEIINIIGLSSVIITVDLLWRFRDDIFCKQKEDPKLEVVYERHTDYTKSKDEQEVFNTNQKTINDFKEEIDILNRFKGLFCYGKIINGIRYNEYPIEHWHEYVIVIENIIDVLKAQGIENENDSWFFLNDKLFYDINAFLELTSSVDGKFMSDEVATTYKNMKKSLANEVVSWHNIMMDSKRKMEEAETKYIIEGFAGIYDEHVQKRNYLPKGVE